MRIYLQAFTVTLLAGALFVAGFLVWKQGSLPQDRERKILTIEEMETKGIPRFEGDTLQGEKISVEDFAGKVVVVNFWASWCGPCIEEFPSLLKLAEELKGELILIAVSGDSSEEDARKFMRQLRDWEKPWIKIVWDKNLSISQRYGVDRLPESFIAGPDLKLVKQIIGSINWYTPDSVEYIREVLKKK